MNKELLKKNGIKATKQRLQIINYISLNNSVTLKEIISNNPNIDQSTIYRVIELFLEKELIFKINKQHDTNYILNNLDHKHYIECIKCHDLEEIDICPYSLIDLKGYKIKNDETIKGICKNCQENDEKIGIFVGSFDPPTKAHFEIGHILINDNILNKIVYVPVDNIKKNSYINLNDRYNMLFSYINSYHNFYVNHLKLNDLNTNFSWRDLDKLNNYYKGSLYVIIGADNLHNLDKWNNYLYLLKKYNFIVINRDDIDVISLIKDKYSNYQDKFIIIDYENNLSSTFVREKINNKEDISNYVSKEVIDYINNNELYK